MFFILFCLHRFCVAIKKENYPDYMPSNIFSDSAKQIFRQPGHTIYLLPTVVICNLLPCELDFYVKGMPINGTLKPGKEAALPTADTSQNIELGKAALALFVVMLWKIPGSILWAFWAPWRNQVACDISLNQLRAKDSARQQSTEPFFLCVGTGSDSIVSNCVFPAAEQGEANVCMHSSLQEEGRL